MSDEDHEIEDNLEQLTSSDENIRSQAALSLGWVGDEKVVQPLIDILINDTSPKVRANAAMSLGQLGSQEAISSLIESLNDKDSNVRGMAIYSLGLMKVDKAATALIKVLQSDPDKEAKIAAADSLGQIAKKESLYSIIELFVIEENEDIRKEIKSCLEKIAKTNNIDNLDKLLARANEKRKELAIDEKTKEKELIMTGIKEKELEKKRMEQIKILVEKLPPLLEFAIHEEEITYEKVCQKFDCEDVTLELALNKIPKTTFDIEINSIERYFKVLKPQADISDEAKEKIKLLRKKYGVDW